jgi:ribonuclease VapC
MCRYLRCTRADAEATLADFLDRHDIAILPIDADVGRLARVAYGQFGKGQGHPAQLNLGDCFSHALATKHAAVLLFVGDDFVAAGMSSALASP